MPPALFPHPTREVHALVANLVRCSLATDFGPSACLEGKRGNIPRFFFLPIRVNMPFYKWRVLTPQFLTLILRGYHTLLGLRMPYLDSEGGKRELAAEKRNIKRANQTTRLNMQEK